jgi:hypothetical protein
MVPSREWDLSCPHSTLLAAISPMSQYRLIFVVNVVLLYLEHYAWSDMQRRGDGAKSAQQPMQSPEYALHQI